MNGDNIGALVAAAVLVIVVVYVGIKLRARNRERGAELRQWAQRHGGTFTAKDTTLAARWKYAPIHGAGSVTNVVRGTVDGKQFTGFTHTLSSSGGSPTSRAVGILDIGIPLPTAVIGSPEVIIRDPRPSHLVDFRDPSFEWPAFAADASAATALTRLFTPEVRQRLIQEASGSARVELMLDGQEILVCTFGDIDGPRLDRWVALLQDMARMLKAQPHPGAH